MDGGRPEAEAVAWQAVCSRYPLPIGAAALPVRLPHL
jgi:hypothetical protein